MRRQRYGFDPLHGLGGNTEGNPNKNQHLFHAKTQRRDGYSKHGLLNQLVSGNQRWASSGLGLIDFEG